MISYLFADTIGEVAAYDMDTGNNRDNKFYIVNGVNQGLTVTKDTGK